LSFSSANIRVISKLAALDKDSRRSPLHALSSFDSTCLTDSRMTARASGGRSDFLKIDSTAVRGMFLIYCKRDFWSDLRAFKSASSWVTDLGTPCDRVNSFCIFSALALAPSRTYLSISADFFFCAVFLANSAATSSESSESQSSIYTLFIFLGSLGNSAILGAAGAGVLMGASFLGPLLIVSMNLFMQNLRSFLWSSLPVILWSSYKSLTALSQF